MVVFTSIHIHKILRIWKEKIKIDYANGMETDIAKTLGKLS